MTKSSVTLDDISQEIKAYLKARDWDKKNSSRSLATSIVLEAGELLEHYQWGDKPVGDTAALADELADIFIYSIEFAQANNINIAEAIETKLAIAKKKYPAKNFKGKSKGTAQKIWLDTKLRHQKKGL
jgi:NTP pyrophosphatase (non-canonical NTP hydrolase)